MKRALDNIERATLKLLRNLGYTPEVKESKDYRGRPVYYAEVIERKSWISLSSPGDLSDIPHNAKSKTN